MRKIQTIEYAEAKRIIDAIVDKLLEEGKAAVVAVADTHGELIAFARMDGAAHLFDSNCAEQGVDGSAGAQTYQRHRRESPTPGKRVRYRVLRRSAICRMGRRSSGAAKWPGGRGGCGE